MIVLQGTNKVKINQNHYLLLSQISYGVETEGKSVMERAWMRKKKCKVSDAIDVSCNSASTRLSRYALSKISSSSIVVDLSRFGNEIGRS